MSTISTDMSPPRWASVRYLIFQLMRFGLVGMLATATHGTAYFYFVTAELLTPVMANFAAYAIAFSLSFIGHRYWTFGDTRSGRDPYALLRFLTVSLSGLGVNTAAVLVLVTYFQLPAWTPLIVIVGVTPVCTFLFSRFWVFCTRQ